MSGRGGGNKKITNSDVYGLRLATMHARLDSIRYEIDHEGGITKEAYEALGRVSDELGAVADHIVHGFPLKQPRC